MRPVQAWPHLWHWQRKTVVSSTIGTRQSYDSSNICMLSHTIPYGMVKNAIKSTRIVIFMLPSSKHSPNRPRKFGEVAKYGPEPTVT